MQGKLQDRESAELAQEGQKMNLGERKFVISKFSDYYSNADFKVKNVERREFGVGNSKKIDSRHLAFRNFSELKSYLTSNTPLFVSHSAAYYHFPGATPIEKKQRIGADLIFDLDIHASGKYGVYSKLEEAKRDVFRLMDEFLLNDFGIDKKNILVVFSGNRGYHIHVNDDEYLLLGGDERREIVNYIRGEGLNYDDFFEWKLVERHKKLYGPKPDEGGYRGRIARMIVDNPKALAPRILNDDGRRKLFLEGIKEGDWSRISLQLSHIPKMVSDIANSLPVRSVNADAAVTHDMSKLIRLPNSIHGETGFIAKIVDDLDKFNPLNDALLNKNNKLEVIFLENVPEIQMLDSTFGPYKKDEKIEIPEPLALLYALKESATLVLR